ncbi:MAG: PhoH family protein, partial [Prochlorococcaceae cyanobacterium]
MAESEGLCSTTLSLPSPEAALALSGEGESTLRRLEALTGATLVLRGLDLSLRARAPQLERATSLLDLLRPLWQDGQSISQVDLNTALQALDSGRGEEHRDLSNLVLARSQTGRLLRPRTLRQKAYVQAMERHDLTLALGPAGTGKTFLATVLAVRMLQDRRVERLILTRPAVEAGERLGF